MSQQNVILLSAGFILTSHDDFKKKALQDISTQLWL